MQRKRRKQSRVVVKQSLNLESDLANFPKDMLNEINLLRYNPMEYVEKIRSHMAFIKIENDKSIYNNGSAKISLPKGIDAFNECIEILLKTSPLGPLKLSEEIRIDVPDDTEIQTKSFNQLQSKIKANHPEKKISCSLDVGTPNPETSLVLQLVDDNKTKGTRRNNLLDSSFTNLGVSIKKFKSKACTIYLTFSD